MTQRALLALIVGARPNIIKIAPIVKALRAYPRLRRLLIHTGQHYDWEMSRSHFRDLGIPEPDCNLKVGSGSHAKQTGVVMARLEKVLIQTRPRCVVVVGDVNSTLAGALTAKKLHIPVAHVEAGLRSFDREMPEEINRLATDSIADFLFTHSEEANRHLRHEGVAAERIFFVGNVMIDTLKTMLPLAKRMKPLRSEPYVLATLHRPSNVDDPVKLRRTLTAFAKISMRLPLYFPIHPRTRRQLKPCARIIAGSRIIFLDPLPYTSMLSAQLHASLVITDSGGLQEETTVLGVPCLTLRENTERGVTITHGTNQLVGEDPNRLVRTAMSVLQRGRQKYRRPPLWDGRASERIAGILNRVVGS